MSFNAQEILARLRAQSTSVPDSIPIPVLPATVIESPSKSVVTKAVVSTKIIKAPTSLTLTPSQREENLNVRIELEKDIKSLQEEITALKLENRQLRNDKEDVERQFIEHKIRSEDCITKLRGKLAAISMGICPVPNHLLVEDRHNGGRLYPVPPPSHGGVNIPTIKPHQQSPHVFLKSNGGNLTPSFSSPGPPPGFYPSPGGIPYSNGENYTQLDGEGFRDPTFSELMRRSTFDKPEFKDSLRRTSDKRIPVQQAAHNSASKLPVRNNNGPKVLKAHTPVLTGRHHQQQHLQSSYNSPQPHYKTSNEFYSPSSGENKSSIANHNSSSNNESSNVSIPSSNLGNVMTSRKTSKSALEINPVVSTDGFVRSGDDDDDLEVVEIDLRH